MRTDVVTGIAGLTLSAPQHEALAAQWGQLLGIDLHEHAGALQIPLRAGFLRFVPGGSRSSMHTVHLAGRGPTSLKVGDLLVTTELPG